MVKSTGSGVRIPRKSGLDAADEHQSHFFTFDLIGIKTTIRAAPRIQGMLNFVKAPLVLATHHKEFLKASGNMDRCCGKIAKYSIPVFTKR